MTAATNPYPYDTPEHHAWHRGYEGLIFMHSDSALSNIYDAARQQAVDDCLGKAATTVEREVIDGHRYYVLYVNKQPVFKSMIVEVVNTLKEKLDKALCEP